MPAADISNILANARAPKRTKAPMSKNATDLVFDSAAFKDATLQDLETWVIHNPESRASDLTSLSFYFESVEELEQYKTKIAQWIIATPLVSEIKLCVYREENEKNSSVSTVGEKKIRAQFSKVLEEISSQMRDKNFRTRQISCWFDLINTAKQPNDAAYWRSIREKKEVISTDRLASAIGTVLLVLLFTAGLTTLFLFPPAGIAILAFLALAPAAFLVLRFVLQLLAKAAATIDIASMGVVSFALATAALVTFFLVPPVGIILLCVTAGLNVFNILSAMSRSLPKKQEVLEAVRSIETAALKNSNTAKSDVEAEAFKTSMVVSDAKFSENKPSASPKNKYEGRGPKNFGVLCL